MNITLGAYVVDVNYVTYAYFVAYDGSLRNTTCKDTT